MLLTETTFTSIAAIKRTNKIRHFEIKQEQNIVLSKIYLHETEENKLKYIIKFIDSK